jgi:ABC-type amino acid transport substrate-binding protein
LVSNKFHEESEWGMRTVNGSWDGLIGRLTKDEADIALADFHMTADRLQAVDFLHTLQATA